MAYFAVLPDSPQGLSCGPSCSCGPCRGAARLSEWYVKPEDGDDDGEPQDDSDNKVGWAAGPRPWPRPSLGRPLHYAGFGLGAGRPRHASPLRRSGAPWFSGYPARMPRRW